MGGVLPVTAVIAARNEAVNIERCLASVVGRVARVVVVDSHSDDGTAALARAAGAEVVQFDYRGGYPKKRQWALESEAISTDWTLLLDADEVVPAALWSEIAERISRDEAPAGYLVSKGFHFMGRRFRFGGFSHAAVILFKSGRARFERLAADEGSGMDMEVHERLLVDGPVGALRTPLIHEDFKGLEAYVERHRRYAVWEAAVRSRFLKTGAWGEDAITPRLLGNTQERRRALKRIAIRLPIEPELWFIYHYLVRLGVLEGRAGLVASKVRYDYIKTVRRLVRGRAETDLEHG